jgi:hypothetical protein
VKDYYSPSPTFRSPICYVIMNYVRAKVCTYLCTTYVKDYELVPTKDSLRMLKDPRRVGDVAIDEGYLDPLTNVPTSEEGDLYTVIELPVCTRVAIIVILFVRMTEQQKATPLHLVVVLPLRPLSPQPQRLLHRPRRHNLFAQHCRLLLRLLRCIILLCSAPAM